MLCREEMLLSSQTYITFEKFKLKSKYGKCKHAFEILNFRVNKESGSKALRASL